MFPMLEALFKWICVF